MAWSAGLFFSIFFFDPERNVAVNAELGIFMVFLRDGRFCLFAYFPGLICSYQYFFEKIKQVYKFGCTWLHPVLAPVHQKTSSNNQVKVLLTSLGFSVVLSNSNMFSFPPNLRFSNGSI